MKRTYPLSDKEGRAAKQLEVTLINGLLGDLFNQERSDQRQIPISNKGYWMNELNHVKVDSLKGLPHEFVIYSRNLQYHYLNPYEALYCLESSSLIIFHRGYPLSLLEAYHLLLKDKRSFKNYRVFQRLNRTGFICLKPQFSDSTKSDNNKSDSSPNPTTRLLEVTHDLTNRSIYEIDSIQDPTQESPRLNEVLTALRDHGPQEYTKFENEDHVGSHDIAFDVYKKEHFDKNKPRKDSRGNPDYQLIIEDNITKSFPDYTKLFLTNDDQQQVREFTNEKLIYALIDCENTICFVKFDALGPEDLELF